MRTITGIAALAGALLLAGCGTAAQPGTAATRAPAPAASTPSPAATLTGDTKACHAMAAYPEPHTQQQVNDYLSFLSRQSLVATSPQLKTAIMNMNAGALGVMAGTISTAQEDARVAHLNALCATVTGGTK